MSEQEPAEDRVIRAEPNVIQANAPVIPAEAGIHEQREEPSAPEGEGPIPVPWHFKLLMVALTLYLGFRAFQGAAWVWQRFH